MRFPILRLNVVFSYRFSLKKRVANKNNAFERVVNEVGCVSTR
jgi:hypothetical protein